MDGPEHWLEAERLLTKAETVPPDLAQGWYIPAAQAHATLAVAGQIADAVNELHESTQQIRSLTDYPIRIQKVRE